MTREEFMKTVRLEIGLALQEAENRIMNIVEEAWAEGKKSAEVEYIHDILREAISNYEDKHTEVKEK